MVRRVIEATNELASKATGDVRKLAGRNDEYRLRVGEFRVLFTYTATQVVVLRVRPRREAYR